MLFALAVFLAYEDSHGVTGESIRAAGDVRGVGESRAF